MSKIESDFERFLYANYPDDYRRATSADVSDSTITTILVRHVGHYNAWKNIPEWIKNKYQDVLPREVLNGQEGTREFIEKETHTAQKDEENTSALIDFSVSVLAMGYSAQTAAQLTKNRAKREELLQAADGGEFTAAQLAAWLATRESDKDAITTDWQNNQPEKYLVHLVKELSRAQKRAARGGQTSETALEISTLEKDLASYVQGLSSKEEKTNLVNYLRQAPQQAALRNLTTDSLNKFTSMLADNGIRITPTAENGTQTKESSRTALFDTLKSKFSEQFKLKQATIQQLAASSRGLTKVRASDVVAEIPSDGIDKLVSMYQGTQRAYKS
jgi:hypothetical protein